MRRDNRRWLGYGKGIMVKHENIEEQLRQAILGADVTRADLARASGVSEGILSRFVRGERTLRLDTAATLAAALGLSLTGGPTKPTKAKRPAPTKQGHASTGRRTRRDGGRKGKA